MWHFKALLLTILIGQISLSNENPLRLDEAMNQAKSEDRNILMVFSGSDWCKPCIQLKKEVLNTSDFTQFASKNLVILTLDFPYSKKNQLAKEQRQYNDEMAEKYNPEGAFPKIILLNANGEIITELSYTKGLRASQFIEKINVAL